MRVDSVLAQQTGEVSDQRVTFWPPAMSETKFDIARGASFSWEVAPRPGGWSDNCVHTCVEGHARRVGQEGLPWASSSARIAASSISWSVGSVSVSSVAE